MSLPLDAFVPAPDVRERFEATIRAPRHVVMAVATGFDMQSPSIVRAIFWMRERFMGAAPREPRPPRGLLDDMRALGWGLLLERPGELVIGGAACQPWEPDVRFAAIAADRFASYAEPNQVKIAWTLEATAIGPELTRFAHETRAVATDAASRRRFLAYWRWARFGIIAIRWVLLPAIRREAERQWALR